MKRVVITGQGVISSLGIGIRANKLALKNGESGISTLTFPNSDNLQIKIGGAIKCYSAKDFFTEKQMLFFDDFTQFAIVAANEAMTQSGLEVSARNPSQLGVVIGNAGGGLNTQDENFKLIYQENKKRLHPFIVPKMMNNSASSNLSILFNAQGPSFTVSTACASSNHAMGQAFKLIQSGNLIAAITGGTESMLTYGGVKAWEGLRVMSNTACKPFSLERDGMVQGEGSAIFVFEEYEHARTRNANILAEVIGFSMTSDAYDIIRPNRKGAARAISAALSDAKVNIDDVDYINAHGTGTILNDKIECDAIKDVFGSYAMEVLVSSTKSMHGHLIGGAGAIELVATIMSLSDGIVAPTINYGAPDPKCDLNIVKNESRKNEVNVAISNAFAFGGTNGVIALKRV